MNWEKYVSKHRDVLLERKVINGLGESIVARLVDYLDQWSIRNVVVGISGGIDSALVLAMLCSAADRTKHRVTIHATTILYGDHPFDYTHIRALKEWIEDDPNVIFTTEMLPYQSLVGDVSKQQLMQMTYQHRYHYLFALAQKVGGITVGTTNQDEVGFVGWFGKTSDMMVDVQPIHDLHKCQVVALAKRFCLPDMVIDRAPQGDLYNETTDEENFGCTYDELAVVTDGYQVYGGESGYDRLYRDFMELSNGRLAKAFLLHQQNRHKYQKHYTHYNPIFL